MLWNNSCISSTLVQFELECFTNKPEMLACLTPTKRIHACNGNIPRADNIPPPTFPELPYALLIPVFISSSFWTCEVITSDKGSPLGTGYVGYVGDLELVWSLTQFYAVDLSRLRIVLEKCLFNKRTIKVFVSCCWRCPGTFAPSAPHLTVSLYLCSSGSNARGESRAREGRRVSSKSPSRVRDQD